MEADGRTTYHRMFSEPPMRIFERDDFLRQGVAIYGLYLAETTRSLVDKLLEFEVFPGANTRSEAIPPQCEQRTKVQSL